MLYWKRLTWKHLFILLLLLHLVPLWVVTYFPSQDGASHIYNAYTLKEHHKHANYTLRDVFELNLTIFPNWLSHLTLALLLCIFPPLISEKILLTFAVGLVPVSFFYFLDAVHKRAFLFGWLGFLFSYNYLLFMGFYNFQLSISLFFFSFGYWWKHREELGVGHLIVLYMLLLMTFLGHIVSYGLVLLAMTTVALWLWGSGAIAAGWKMRRGISRGGQARVFLHGLRPVFRFVGYMLPAYFVLAEYFLESLKAYNDGFQQSPEWLADYFWGVKSLVYFTDWHIPVHHALLGVLGVAVVVSVTYRIRRRQWLHTTDPFLLIAVLFTTLFIKAPWGFGPGVFINDRIHLYVLLMLAPWFVPEMGRFFRHGITGALVAICLIHLGRTVYDQARLSAEVAEQVSGAHLIEPHTTFTVRSPNWNRSNAMGDVKYVAPFAHAGAFYGLYAQDVGHLANYEANYTYFPVNYLNNERYDGREDYVVAWAFPEAEPFADLTPNYALIHQTPKLKLFRRRPANGPDLSAWSLTPDGRLFIRFDMEPNGATTAEGYHRVSQDTRYVSGKFGWVTYAARDDFRGPESLPEPCRDHVRGVDDAAFKLDLPNGTYRVTDYFCSAEDAAHEVNLLANGAQVVNNLIVPPGHNAIERTYTVTVTQGYLTHVIYTQRKRVRQPGRHDHWIWSALAVEQIPADQ